MRIKKRVYNACTIKKVNLKQLSKEVQDSKITFGVDVAKEKFLGTLMAENKEIIQIIKWKSPDNVREMGRDGRDGKG